MSATRHTLHPPLYLHMNMEEQYVRREDAIVSIVQLCGQAFLNMLEDCTNNANVHELLEWTYPEVVLLPGSEEDEDQTEYIRHLEAFEDMIHIAGMREAWPAKLNETYERKEPENGEPTG